MNRRTFLHRSAAAAALAAANPLRAAEPALPEPSPQKLPRWRGFNLLEKFTQRNGGNPGFSEDDFRMIADLGFNFVRLPMSYLCWTDPKDWTKLSREEELKHIDQAIEFGRKYRIHVNLNFHRGPGYCVNPPKEPRDLWTDDVALEVCSLHWAAFARRFKGIPNREVTFDLLNEPPNIEEPVYARVARQLVKAIRSEDPKRLIIADALKWGNQPVIRIADLGVGQSTRGYAPMEISHYKASWVNSANHPIPVWPRTNVSGGTLASPAKGKDSHPIIIKGPFKAETTLRLKVGKVSGNSTIVAEADGKPIFTKEFKLGPGAGEWKTAEFKAEWNIYQNTFDKSYTATIPKGTEEVRLRTAGGDWIQLTELGLTPAARSTEDVVFCSGGWGENLQPLKYQPDASNPFPGHKRQDAEWLWQTQIEPFKKLEALGVGVHVGEWGAYQKTPHAVALRWMEDCLRNWQKAGWGWALWNFRGSFGPLDSGRSDVDYENFHGRKLDRKMMSLLQRY